MGRRSARMDLIIGFLIFDPSFECRKTITQYLHIGGLRI